MDPFMEDVKPHRQTMGRALTDAGLWARDSGLGETGNWQLIADN
jgi:hypothetical protein